MASNPPNYWPTTSLLHLENHTVNNYLTRVANAISRHYYTCQIQLYRTCEQSKVIPRSIFLVARDYIIRHLGWPALLVYYLLFVIKRKRVALVQYQNSLILDLLSGKISYRKVPLDQLTISEASFFLSPSLKQIRVIRAFWKIISPDTKDIVFKDKSNSELSLIKYYSYSHKMSIEYAICFISSYLIADKILDQISPSILNIITCELSPFNLGFMCASCLKGLKSCLYVDQVFYDETLVQSIHNTFDRILASNNCFLAKSSAKSNCLIYGESITLPAFASIDDERIKVGLFLSSYYTFADRELHEFLSPRLQDLLLRLNSQWEPQLIMIFCHPNDTRPIKLLNKQLSCLGIRIEFFKRWNNEKFAIGIAGNSLVINEILLSGTPVLYTPDLDDYPYDDYGYVRNNVVASLGIEVPSLRSISDDYSTRERMSSIKSYYERSSLHEVISYKEFAS